MALNNMIPQYRSPVATYSALRQQRDSQASNAVNMLATGQDMRAQQQKMNLLQSEDDREQQLMKIKGAAAAAKYIEKFPQNERPGVWESLKPQLPEMGLTGFNPQATYDQVLPYLEQAKMQVYGYPEAPETRTVLEGQEKVNQEWQPSRGNWKEVGRGASSSGVTQNVYSGSNPYMKKMAENFFTEKEKVPTALKSLRNLEVMDELLDDGMITGSTAGIQESVGNFLKEIGLWDDKSGLLKNTQSYYAATAKETANIIQEFGAGTGLSDADREYALKAAGGEISMTEESLRNIIAINRIATLNAIAGWNQEVDIQPDEMLPNKNRFKVDVPKKYKTKIDEYDKEWGYTGRSNKGETGDEENPVIDSQEEFDALESGTVYIDKLDGKAYRKP